MSPTTRLIGFYLLAFSAATLLPRCLPESRRGKPAAPMFKSAEPDLGRLITDGGASRGVAWVDADSDGDDDLYVSNTAGQWNAFYRNDRGRFKKMTERGNGLWGAAAGFSANSEGVSWVDIDGDSDLDLFLANRGENAKAKLFLNENGASFQEVKTGILVESDISASMACWADYDGDGDLDVFLAGYRYNGNMAFENLGDGNFKKADTEALFQGTGRARTCTVSDANGDFLPDLFVGNARRPNQLLINQGNWAFTNQPPEFMTADSGYTYGSSWADYDGDGDADLFVANFNKENVLYQNDGSGSLHPADEAGLNSETGGASKGNTWGDFDNDGDLDLFVANGTYGPRMFNFLYLNDGNGGFERDSSDVLSVHADTSAGVASSDFDRDGDLDIFMANWGASDQINRFYENTSQGNNWLTLRLIGSGQNRFGWGAKVQLKVTINGATRSMYRWVYPATGYASQNSLELHFGLGKATMVDSLFVFWPTGTIDRFGSVQPKRHYTASENGALTESI